MVFTPCPRKSKHTVFHLGGFHWCSSNIRKTSPHLCLVSLAGLIFDFFFYFHIVMDAALSVASCVHVSTSSAPFIESNLIQTLPTLPVSPCYNCNRQHRPNIAVTLQMSHSSFPPCWRKTELVIKAHQIRDDPCFEAPIFFAIQVMNHFWVSIVLHTTLQSHFGSTPTNI